MTTPGSISSAVLARYLSGTATPVEQAAVEAWVGEDPARKAAVAEWRTAWQADVGRLSAPYDAEVAWARLTERVGLLTLVRSESMGPGKSSMDAAHRLSLTPWAASAARRANVVRWATAAVVALAVGVGTWQAFSPWGAKRAVAAAGVREYTTAPGQRGLIRLPDGTKVMLNVASRLRVPATFGRAGAPRDVTLDGEAYFTVVHDATRPFTVRTARGAYRDVGTRFDVWSYRDSPEEQVTVAEGEITARSNSDNATGGELALRQGQGAVITGSGQLTRMPRSDISQALAWTEGRLPLDGVTLAEAARRMSRWYALDVRVVGTELAQRRVVGSYGDEPVAEVLGIVAAAVGARYEMHEQSVTFVARAGR